MARSFHRKLSDWQHGFHVWCMIEGDRRMAYIIRIPVFHQPLLGLSLMKFIAHCSGVQCTRSNVGKSALQIGHRPITLTHIRAVFERETWAKINFPLYHRGRFQKKRHFDFLRLFHH